MMSSENLISRRDFLVATAGVGTALLSGCGPRDPSGWEFLDNRQAEILKAFCDQIVPADKFPSASQAGVLTFIDRQLVRSFRRHRETYVAGLEQANQICRKLFSCDLDVATTQQKFEVVQSIEAQNPTFFELVLNHTLEGYYGSPRHGGNRDAESWHMLGLAEPPLRGRAQDNLKKDSPA